MYVYTQTERNLWTVGFYAPDGSWHTDSDHNDTEKAAARVAYLNGGQVSQEPTVHERDGQWYFYDRRRRWLSGEGVT